MRRITLLVTLFAVFLAAGVYAQPRSLGARRLVIDNGAGTNTYITSDNGLGVSVLPSYAPAACAILDLNSNTSGVAKLGFLGPRVAEVDKINICGGTPPAGMLIYNSTFNYYEFFNGAVWAPIVSGWSLHGNGSTIPPAPSTTPSMVNPGDYFLGSLDAVDFAIVTNSRQRVRVEGDNAATGNTVEILNDGALSTGLKIYANGGMGINVDPASTGIRLDATGTGILFAGSQPAIGIDMTNGATNTGLAINMPAFATAGINLVGPDFSNSINISNTFGNGINISEIFGNGVNVTNTGNNGVNISSTTGVGLNINSTAANGIVANGVASATGISLTGYTTSITTDNVGVFGNGAGADNQTFNMGSGNMTMNTTSDVIVNLAGGGSDLILNGIDQTAIPAPFDNILWLNGNIVEQTINGVNVVTGSGTFLTVPLWTPDGFKLGNSYLSQSSNAAGGTITSSERMIINSTVNGNMLTVNSNNAASTGIKINGPAAAGIDIDPVTIGIILDATSIGIDYQGSNPTTGINLRSTTTGLNYVVSPTTGVNLLSTTTGINFANAPTTGINLQGGTTGINFANTPSTTGILWNTGANINNGINIVTTGSVANGYSMTAGGGASGNFYNGTLNGGLVGSFYSATLNGGLGTNGYSMVLNGGILTNGALVRTNGGIVTSAYTVETNGGIITNGLMVNEIAGIITNGANINNVDLGVDINNAITGIDINSTGGTSLTANQNIISTGGFGRFANGVATNTAAPNPIGNQVTWFNGNSGTLSTQALTAARTWLLPDETGVLDAYDPLNNNGFVYFQPEVPQVGSAAGSYGNNNLISMQGLAATPNGIVINNAASTVGDAGGILVNMAGSTAFSPDAFSAVISGDNASGYESVVTGTTNVNGAFAFIGDVDGPNVEGIDLDVIATGAGAVTKGADIEMTGAGTGNITAFEGSIAGLAGDDAFGANLDVVGPGDDGFGINLLVQGFSDDNTGIASSVNGLGGSTQVFGVRSTVTGGTSLNYGFDANATGVGSIGLIVRPDARLGVQVNDISTLGASTGVQVLRTVGGIQIAGMDVQAQSGTINDGYTARTAGLGVILRGFRAQGPNTGFVNDRTDNTGYSTTTQTGTGYEAPSVTSGVGFAGNVTGDGEAVNVTVSGASTGRGVVSTNNSTAAASSAGEFIGNASNVPGSTNIAMQITRGDITVGREVNASADPNITEVEFGITEGPSGVVDGAFNFPGHAGNSISVSGDLTVNNQHVTANSIILITPLTVAPGPGISYSIQVVARGAGAFNVRATHHSNPGFAGAVETVRFGYLVINPDR